MNKQQLLNRRSRLSDMLAHLEASRNNSLPSGDVEALLTVDEIVELRRRTKAAADDLKRRLDAMGVKDWISHAGLTGYLDTLAVAKRETASRFARIKKLEDQNQIARHQIGGRQTEIDWCKNYVENWHETMSGRWNKLTDYQKSFFSDPHPNPKSALDLPNPGYVANAVFPDEMMPVARIQHLAISGLIKKVDAALAELEAGTGRP